MSNHTRLLDKAPSAIICVDGNERKIYQGNQIFLNDGENFQIRLFNPEQVSIGVEIIFNGQKKNDGLLVLKPGEDVTLDRFLGEKKKMKYETYLIDGNNKSAVKAAALNGLVEFKFHKEKNSISYNITTGTIATCCCTTGLSHTYYGDMNVGSSGTNGTVNYKSATRSSEYKSPGVFTNEKDQSYKEYLAENKVETGRIEKGPESNQNLTTVDVEFNSTPFYIITYQLKPNSQKPVEITEIRQYCVKCGYRLRKSNWKFCPCCGLEIE